MPRRKRNFRWLKWLLFLVLIAAAVTVIILVKNNFEKTDGADRQATETSKAEETKKEEKEDTQADKSEEESKQEEKAPQYDGDSPNKSETLTGMITYADVKDGVLIVRVNIDQFLSNGACNLVMSKNGATQYTQSVGIIESVTTSTCDGYKIPVSELSEGDFTVEINLESEGKTGKITGRVRI